MGYFPHPKNSFFGDGQRRAVPRHLPSAWRRRRLIRIFGRGRARDKHGRRGVAAIVAAHRVAQHAAVHADRAGALHARALGRQRHVTPAFAHGARRRKDHDWRMLRETNIMRFVKVVDKLAGWMM